MGQLHALGHAASLALAAAYSAMANPAFKAAFFVLRTPVSSAAAWEGLEASGIERDLTVPLIREALWLGSPEFAGLSGEGLAEEGREQHIERRERT